MSHPSHPPFDPELAAALELVRDEVPSRVSPDMIADLQASTVATPDEAAQLEQQFGVTLESLEVSPDLDVVVGRPENLPETGAAPIIFFVHGGGMILGSALFGLHLVLPWADQAGAVVVSPEYRLAPQHPDPTPADDCWAALLWTRDHAQEIGGDPARILVVGHSAGGGLAAGLALRARDTGEVRLTGQLLMCPMLDDRQSTPSSQELAGVGVWDREANQTGWSALLGDRVGGPDVSSYAAASRADHLGGLAPAFLDVGTVDIFRDEVLDYARRMWADRGEAELHIWPGAYHSFENVAPEAEISRRALRARATWAVHRLTGSSAYPD